MATGLLFVRDARFGRAIVALFIERIVLIKEEFVNAEYSLHSIQTNRIARNGVDVTYYIPECYNTIANSGWFRDNLAIDAGSPIVIRLWRVPCAAKIAKKARSDDQAKRDFRAGRARLRESTGS